MAGLAESPSNLVYVDPSYGLYKILYFKRETRLCKMTDVVQGQWVAQGLSMTLCTVCRETRSEPSYLVA